MFPVYTEKLKEITRILCIYCFHFIILGVLWLVVWLSTVTVANVTWWPSITCLSSIRKSFLFIYFFLYFGVCFVSKVWERAKEISIKSFWLHQWRWPNRDATCWLGLSPRLFGRVLMIFLCVRKKKKGLRIGVAAYWILWARPKYFGGAFFSSSSYFTSQLFFFNGRPLLPVTCVQPIIDRPITERDTV
jgi:hypothetical protein